jgi:hypothetical protein
MTPATSTQTQNWLEMLPAPARKRFERITKNFRFVSPVKTEDRNPAQLKYGKVDYFVGYRLPGEAVKQLAEAADPKCYKCLGTGIKDWRAQGLKARVCKCAQPFLATPTTV